MFTVFPFLKKRAINRRRMCWSGYSIGNLCRTIGPLLSQRFLLASAKAQPRGGFPFSSLVCATLTAGAWLLGAMLYAWQFPHFNALSWNLRQDYSRAGYRMTSVTNPDLCRRVALRYSIGMIGLCSLAPVLDLTTWLFAIDSLPLNLYLSYLSWKFYKNADSTSSRKLFRFTLIHIPLLIMFMLISKKTFGEGARKNPTGITASAETKEEKRPTVPNNNFVHR